MIRSAIHDRGLWFRRDHERRGRTRRHPRRDDEHVCTTSLQLLNRGDFEVLRACRSARFEGRVLDRTLARICFWAYSGNTEVLRHCDTGEESFDSGQQLFAAGRSAGHFGQRAGRRNRRSDRRCRPGPGQRIASSRGRGSFCRPPAKIASLCMIPATPLACYGCASSSSINDSNLI